MAEACSPMTLCCLLFGVICLVCIDGLSRKRQFQGTVVGKLFDKHRYIIADVYAKSAVTCAMHCTQTDGCEDILFREPGTEPDYDHCYTSADHYGYSGHLITTISGLTCQRWDSQFPHVHPYNTSFMIENTLQEAQNYCRDATAFGSIWCLTTVLDPHWDYCNVVKCMTNGNNCRLYSTTSTPNGPWAGYSYFQGMETVLLQQ